MVKFNFEYIKEFIKEEEIKKYNEEIYKIHNNLQNKNCAGSEFTGWFDLPEKIEFDLLKDIYKTAKKVRKKNEIFILIGIGGSYLGARAVIEALTPMFKKDKSIEIIYAGTNISADYYKELLEYLKEYKKKDIYVNVISKSGTTTEPAIAFRIIKNFLIKKYGEKYNKHICAITDAKKGALRKIANAEDYKSYIIPDDIGGRYSVLTPVGLFPIAVSGINIYELINGALDCYKYLNSLNNSPENPAYKYAIIRNILFSKGKEIEILVNYNPKLHYFAEWWKQLFGESEGKEGKGIFPAAVDFTTDLHSLGQLIQEGKRNIFETIIKIEKSNSSEKIPLFEEDSDELNYIANKEINEVNLKALEGTLEAHISGGVPNIIIELDELSAYNIGYLIYFFERACAYSGLLAGINPFNQPGVEAYKKNMFKLLGKK
ncbi:MAG TPA: glucose-6-phosphate isomerase [bacterium]|nr:glucose-6-phosphate isomerase [bacterium]HOL48706.1 glucose-6-phosphate isomerase [bacterium]HPQ18130.1 glucose-6-phosphate isomerase [bacterium]